MADIPTRRNRQPIADSFMRRIFLTFDQLLGNQATMQLGAPLVTFMAVGDFFMRDECSKKRNPKARGEKSK